jgi:primosomal protein N' (replication factor Y)
MRIRGADFRMTIASVALPVARSESFDYWVPAGLDVRRGAVVRVRLARRALIGVVVAVGETSDVQPSQLQPVAEVVGDITLPPDLLALADFVAGYYQAPLGEVLALMLPPLPRNASARARHAAMLAEASDSGSVRHALNDQQQSAASAIDAARGAYAPFLLRGVTGSGKTEVYLAAAAEAIAAGGQCLLLVPEINLTPQLLARVAAALPGKRTVALHSRLAGGERRRAWTAAASGVADLVVGTRLAVFASLPRLALAIVDEEHDPSYKQQDGVRYHARDVAVWRAHDRGVPIVLGSATPSLETLTKAQRGDYRRVDLTHRAAVPAKPPAIVFAPARDPHALEGIGQLLCDAIGMRLSRGEQSLVFINRRGFAPSLLCAACGWQAACPRCSVRLVVHRDARELRCHHCGHAEPLPRACRDCGNVDLLPLGHGTQRLASALAERFPQARILRVDRDSTQRKGAFATMREDIHAGDVDILVGTQMLAKGHDFPRLTLVGVLGADNALYSADFRATERLAALLFQVSGRAGRGELPGDVIVQTDFPTHPLYRALAANDYDGFAATLLGERRITGLPPFGHLALLAAEAVKRSDVDAFLRAAHEAAREALANDAGVDVFPPVPAPLARRAGLERGQVLAQTAQRPALQRFLPRWRAAIAALPVRRVRWAIDVDPAGFG